MQFYPQKSKGFIIDYDLAEQLEILNELLVWEEEWDDTALLEAFGEKFGVEPERVRSFEYSRGGEVHCLQGCDYDSTYILFDDYTEKSCPEEWDNLISILEEKDIDVIEGSWAELGQRLLHTIIKAYKTSPPEFIVTMEIVIVVMIFVILLLNKEEK